MKVSFDLGLTIESPLLMNSLPTEPDVSKEEKARRRGWGEIYFGSYRELLEMCEWRLNTAFTKGVMNPWWENVVGVAPGKWEANPEPPLRQLLEEDLKAAVKDCWFPVHAMGYNWLKSNRDSGQAIAKRIETLIQYYVGEKYQCEKVIIVTHSMGGLVARALIHPSMGNLESKVLGVVHGVQPSLGAGTAYKRMRCGFEDSKAALVPKILGNHGDEVTAVLGNSPGGLELLPSKKYGNGWLSIMQNGRVLSKLPKNGDPYEEIYKAQGTWYQLLRKDWINPAEDTKGGLKRCLRYLDDARKFHDELAGVFHKLSYAHYGNDRARMAWRDVVWQMEGTSGLSNPEPLQITSDNRKGTLQMRDPSAPTAEGKAASYRVTMGPPTSAGDQTVPAESADDQLRSGVFKGIFCQSGYEHQDSYKDAAALHSTLYSIVRIAQTMQWSKP